MMSSVFKKSLRKGDVGERIVRASLEGKGWVVYQPVTEGAHHFDMLSIKDKKTAIALDVKTKARMNHYPATGINQRHFEEYQRFSKKHLMSFWIVFVDEMLAQVYGNTLKELEKPREVQGNQYPMIKNWNPPIRLWPLEAMKNIAQLQDCDKSELINLSQRKHEYSEEIMNKPGSAA